jgi:hypothetical protein
MRQLRHVDPFHRIANTAGCSPAFAQDQTIARFAVIALLVLAAAPVAQASPQRVLFVGNSLTAANDLPAMIAAGITGKPAVGMARLGVSVRAAAILQRAAAAALRSP